MSSTHHHHQQLTDMASSQKVAIKQFGPTGTKGSCEKIREGEGV